MPLPCCERCAGWNRKQQGERVNKVNVSGIGMTSQRTRERLIGRLIEQGIDDWSVLDVMRSTPRHIFLDEALAHRAYEDVALPIGFNQTISQPYIVARMRPGCATMQRNGWVRSTGWIFREMRRTRVRSSR